MQPWVLHCVMCLLLPGSDDDGHGRQSDNGRPNGGREPVSRSSMLLEESFWNLGQLSKMQSRICCFV